jgi:4-hydroxybenzoate polyprenyltransferase
MFSFLSLIRWPNLLMIAFVEYMMRYAVMRPLVRLYGFELQLGDSTFACLVLAVICTAAAGYAINDYFDVRADTVNRPHKVVVGKGISRRRVMMTHIILCILGILLGGYVTWRAGVPQLALLFIIVAGMLWLYSFSYKRQFLIGNLIVALFMAMVPLMVLLDIPLLNKVYRQILLDEGGNFNVIMIWIACFSIFAFLATLSREIIKDTEYFEGDKAYGYRSVIIVLGTKIAKWVIIGIHALIFAALGAVFLFFLKYNLAGQFDYLSFFYFLICIAIPLIRMSWKVYKAKSSNDYHIIGNWMKWVMIAGTSYGLVVYYNAVWF